jgi:hypothetical protein
MQGEMLCEACYKQIKAWIDEKTKEQIVAMTKQHKPHVQTSEAGVLRDFAMVTLGLFTGGHLRFADPGCEQIFSEFAAPSSSWCSDLMTRRYPDMAIEDPPDKEKGLAGAANTGKAREIVDQLKRMIKAEDTRGDLKGQAQSRRRP